MTDVSVLTSANGTVALLSLSLHCHSSFLNSNDSTIYGKWFVHYLDSLLHALCHISQRWYELNEAQDRNDLWNVYMEYVDRYAHIVVWLKFYVQWYNNLRLIECHILSGFNVFFWIFTVRYLSSNDWLWAAQQQNVRLFLAIFYSSPIWYFELFSLLSPTYCILC